MAMAYNLKMISTKLHPQILESDAHKYLPKNCLIPSIELQAVKEGRAQPAPGSDRLVEVIKIKGTSRPRSLPLHYELGRPYLQETQGANGNSKSAQCVL